MTFRHALLALSLLAFTLSAAQGGMAAEPFETKAAEALMVDAETGTILFSKNPDQPVPPASLAKLMTMELVFHAISEGRLSLDHTFPVSENAWRHGGAGSGGSTMFAKLKSEISLQDLIQGVIVQAANDGAIIIAEGMAGSEAAFGEQMTARARAIGLTVSTFRNATGLPAEGQVVTMRELVTLARHIRRSYPEFYKYYSQPQFTWNKITQRNRNPLLRMGMGADGMMTGYTKDSGYSLVGLVERDGRRLVLAMGGMATDRERTEEARRIVEWGMHAFTRQVIAGRDEILGEARVYGGDADRVALTAREPVSVLVPVSGKEHVVARIVYDGPVLAPVTAGSRIGALQVWIGDTLSFETPLYAAQEVGAGSLRRRAFDAVAELAVGWMR